jgi:hypothetical protein
VTVILFFGEEEEHDNKNSIFLGLMKMEEESSLFFRMMKICAYEE